jgi:hypothetical protein
MHTNMLWVNENKTYCNLRSGIDVYSCWAQCEVSSAIIMYQFLRSTNVQWRIHVWYGHPN